MPEDRDTVAVWQHEQRTRCSCGTWRWEWEDNPDAWFADHETCEGHRRLAEHQKRVMDSAAGAPMGAVFGLYKTPRR